MVIRPWYGGTIAIVPYNRTHVIRDNQGGRPYNTRIANATPFVGTIAPIVRALGPHSATIVGAGFHPRPCPPWTTAPDRP